MTSVTITHTCGAEQEFELDPGEPRTWDHPGAPDTWYPVEPYCCEAVQDDEEAAEAAYQAGLDYQRSRDEDWAELDVRLEDLQR